MSDANNENLSTGMKNKEALSLASNAKKDEFLTNIATHYGIDADKAFEEVTDDNAEYLFEYMTDPLRVEAYNLMKSGKLI